MQVGTIHHRYYQPQTLSTTDLLHHSDEPSKTLGRQAQSSATLISKVELSGLARPRWEELIASSINLTLAD